MAMVASAKGKPGRLADFQRHIRRDLAVRPTSVPKYLRAMREGSPREMVNVRQTAMGPRASHFNVSDKGKALRGVDDSADALSTGEKRADR
jgi:hypothetical protein